jgi:phosphomannomutase
VSQAAERAERWLQADPDEDTRDETRRLLAGDQAELNHRFTGRLQFGTAGLRGALGAGPNRMNRLLVRQAAAGVARYLIGAGESPTVVIGYDARRKSDVFAIDTARVMASMGVRASLLPRPFPTPVLAYATTLLNSSAGIMVTASHNPPADNGYKVFLSDGSQIVSPIDQVISECIDGIDPTTLMLAEIDDSLITFLDDDAFHQYVAMAAAVRLVPEVGRSLRVAYTPMHGVGRETLLAAFHAAGLPAPSVVAAQGDPDGAFPTVSFPNPEEPGALDRLLAMARQIKADIALANDPDADRLGVAIPTASGDWRVLRGDEIGWLLADHILRHTTGDDRLVVTTLVSSSLLGKMAAHYGVHHAETFTGFKWIAAERRAHPELRFVFGYEQALGYLVAEHPADKDGITAAILMAELAGLAAAEGTTVEARLADIDARYGAHRVAERSVPLPPAEGARRVALLRSAPPRLLAGLEVTEVVDFPEANLVRFQCGPNARVQARPSGTEPKVKLYGEAINGNPVELVDALAAVLEDLAKTK